MWLPPESDHTHEISTIYSFFEYQLDAMTALIELAIADDITVILIELILSPVFLK
jgi:hypothetical protein